MFRSKLHSPCGFSLIELLSVMAIVVLIMASMRPALSSLSGSGNLSKTAADLASVYDLARTEAMARNSFVWVGLENVSSPSGSRISAVIAGSLDGSANPAPANLVMLSRPWVFENVRATTESTASQVDGAVAERVRTLVGNATVEQVADNSNGATFQSGTRSFSSTVTFTPEGEALLAGQPSSRSAVRPFLAVYLQTMRGALAGKEQAALLIQGSGGSVMLVRE